MIASGRNREVLDELAGEVDGVEPLVADLSDPAQVSALVSGRQIDVLVANAALPASGRLESFTRRRSTALDVNLRAPVQLARALLPGMRERVRPPRLHLVAVGQVRERRGVDLQRHQVRPARIRLRPQRGAARHGRRLDDGVPRLHPRRGMFADAGSEAAARRRQPHPDQVARAVIKGIETNRAEIDVAPAPAGHGARLFGLAPRLVSVSTAGSGRS